MIAKVFTANIERELDDLGDGFEDEKTYMETVTKTEMFLLDQLVENDEDEDSTNNGVYGLNIKSLCTLVTTVP